MAEAATAVQEARPLTDAERNTLDDLLARDSASEAPSVRVGEPYLALTPCRCPAGATRTGRPTWCTPARRST